MKRESFFHKIIKTALVFGIALLAVACGVGGIRQKPSTKESVNIAEESEKEGKAISNDGPGTESAGEEVTAQPINISDAETESAVLIQNEQEIELQGNVLNYGGLTVEFPEGIEARMIDTKDNGNIFCTENFLSKENKGRIMDLCGAQEVYADRVWGDEIAVYLDLPSRVRLLHYTAVYDSETALLCVLFDLLPEAVGSRMYANQAKKEYAYCLRQDGYLYLFLVKDEEVCLVQEIAEEEKYSFGALLADGAVRWKENGDSVRFWTNPDTFSYRKIVPEEGISLFYVCDRQGDSAELRLYREGNYETPCQVIHGYMKGEDNIHIEDVNFDGCIDLIGSSDTGNSKVYLWNRQTKAYEQAQAEIPLYYLYHRRFPETESVWGVTTYAVPQNWGPTSAAEAIWQWEGSTLVKKKECVVSIVEDGLRVWAYEGTPDRLIFDETFSLEEWEQEQQGRVSLLYEQFYDSMVPEEVYAIEHRMEGERKIIPQELLDEIGSVMAAGKDPAILSEVWGGEESAVLSGESGTYSSYLSSATVGRELTKDETLALAERNMAIRQQVQDAARFNYRYTLVEADCDNDGTDDLVGELYGHFIGGTSGNADYVFWKGQPDGTYVKTDDFGEVKENFGVIAYKGKNYLCRATFDYGRMINNGYALDCYEDGKRVEETVIHVVPERYEIRQISAETGYADSAVRMTEECTTIKEQLDESWMIEGEAEQTTEQTRGQKSAYELTYYHCDLDNDGQEETYSKWYRHLANYNGLDYLDFSMVGSDNEKENRGIAMLVEEMESNADTPVALWVEVYESKNIVNVLYMTGLADYRITGYLVGETDCIEVYEIAADATYKVEQERRAVF